MGAGAGAGERSGQVALGERLTRNPVIEGGARDVVGICLAQSPVR